MRNWRPLTWVVLAVNGLFLLWLIVGMSAAADTSDCVTEACEAGAAIGTGLGMALILFLWVMTDMILGIVWLVTNKNGRDCPTCGTGVKKGLTRCRSCGYDFASGLNAPKGSPAG